MWDIFMYFYHRIYGWNSREILEKCNSVHFWMLVGSKRSESDVETYKGKVKKLFQDGWKEWIKTRTAGLITKAGCSEGKSNNASHWRSRTQHHTKAQVQPQSKGDFVSWVLTKQQAQDTNSQKQCGSIPWKMSIAEERQAGGRLLFNCRWARNFLLASNQKSFFPHPTLVWININKWPDLICHRLLTESLCYIPKRTRELPCLCWFWLPHKVHIQLYWGHCCSKTYYVSSSCALNTTNTWDLYESL